MSAFKQFLTSDIIVTPFKVSKGFYFEGSNSLTGSYVQIDRLLGKNLTTLFDPSTDPTTGDLTVTQYQRLVYSSIKELYYSNHLSSSYGDALNTSSLVPGQDAEGDRYIGTTQSDGRYFEYPQTDVTFAKSFPTGSNEIIGVLSIPSRLYGEYIQPNSFTLEIESGSISDDGEGNLILASTGLICGNIIYGHGLAIITNGGSSDDPSVYGTAVYGTAIYGGAGSNNIINNFVETNNITCSFSSSYDIYETQYKATLRDNEFNFSLNPTLIQNSSTGSVYDFVTGSAFSPYVTTVGLYNESQELLAVGKLAQPLPTSPTTDTTILINIDR